MRQESTDNFAQSCDSHLEGWDYAIRQAEIAISDAKERISRLEIARAVFLESKQKGEPWPTTFESDEKLLGQK